MNACIDPRPDAGDFRQGRLKWDVLNLAAVHRTRLPKSVDLSQCCLLRPYSVACLAAVGARTKNTCVLMPPNDSECAAHLERLGLSRWFANGPDSAPPRRSNLVLQQLTDRSGTFATEAVDLLIDRNAASANIAPRLADHLDELVLNALTHADSPIGCITVGQSFWQAGHIEVCVLDLGQTIRAHLASNPLHHSIQTDEQAIRLALEESVTGTVDVNRWNLPNSGSGLFELSQEALSGRAEMSILSGSAIVSVHRDGVTAVPFRGGFMGTMVNVRFLVE